MSANNPIFVATVDGKRREQWDGDGGMTQPFWCAGGKHWLQFHFGGSPAAIHFTKIERHSLDAPQMSEQFQSPPPGLNGLDILAAPSADVIIARTADHVDFQMPKPSKGVKQPDGSMAFTFTDTPTLRRAQTISVWSHRPSRFIVTPLFCLARCRKWPYLLTENVRPGSFKVALEKSVLRRCG